MSLTIAKRSKLFPATSGAPQELQRENDLQTVPSLNLMIRQDPFFVTLDAYALFAISLLLVIGMHFLEHLLLEFMILTVPVVLLIKNDYDNFLKLGPGGTPPTPSGYATLMWYRLFALRDPFSPPPRNPSKTPSAGILCQNPLPYRPGPRPVVAGLAPQRQLNQPGSLPAYDRLCRSLEALAKQSPAKFVTATSFLEKHGFALFATRPMNVCGNGEVVHIHSSDRSMHMNLHPDDIKEVLEKGWGQRHPMAWTGPVYSPVPDTFVLIFAPRNETDLCTVCRIIGAAIWYTANDKVDFPLAAN